MIEYWIVIVVSLLLSAFFSGIEIAFVSSNKLLIELDKKKELPEGRILSLFMRNQSHFIATMLVGNNFALVAFGIVMAKLLTPALISILPHSFDNDTVILILQTIVSTLIILITAEYLPKSLFRINPNYSLKLFAFPALIIYILLYPVVLLVMLISKGFIWLFFRIKLSDDVTELSPVDLYQYLEEANTQPEEESSLDEEVQMFQKAIDMKEVKLRECMVPRTEIEAIDEKEDIEKLKEKFIESGLSKIVIYSETIDNIIGYVHSFDLFKSPKSIKEIERPIIIVPEAMQANKLLNTFINEKKNIAVVVDEFGGTSGIITLEDLVEEIFGEIQDEYDVEELLEIQNAQGDYILSARHNIDYINEKYNLKLPESEDYETIGGLIIHHHEDIPKANETIDIGNFRFTILQSTKTRIIKVKLNLAGN